MAYKYFSQQLLTTNILDLSNIFPDKQAMAKEQNNVSYGIGDIVLYLQDATNDFKATDSKYIDLDNGVREIVNKYYKSINEVNPFEKDVDEVVFNEFQKGVVPKEAVIVEEGKVTPKEVKVKKEVVPVEENVLEKSEEETRAELLEAIELLELLGDDADEESKEALAILKELV